MTTLTAHAIDPDALTRIRAAGVDDLGTPVTAWVAGGGEPLRCCLRRAADGETIALISYSPHRRPSPWAEVGPVFIHLDPCAGWDAPEGLPRELRTGPRVLRAYRADGSMNYDANAVVADGEDIESTLRTQLAVADVAEVHVRALREQCFTYAVQALDGSQPR